MRFIDAEKIYKNVKYRELVNEMEKALIELSEKKAIIPQRIHIDSKEYSATYLFMPVFSHVSGAVACKYVSVCENNVDLDLPTINGIVMFADAKTGIPLTLLDATALTATRTAAISGVAINQFASDDSKVLSVFGSGTQAETQVYVACTLRDIKKVYVFSLFKEQAEGFIRKVSKNLEADIEFSNDFSKLEESDIILAATTTKLPLFNIGPEKLKNNVHISAIGSFKENMQEIGEQIYTAFKVFVDDKASCIKESGDIIIPLNKGLITENDITEIGTILRKDINYLKSKQTIFKSVGNGLFDLYASKYFSTIQNNTKE